MKVIMFCCGLSLSFYAVSAEHPVDSALQHCLNAQSSTAGMSHCYDQAYQGWDKEMNAQYQNLLSRLNSEQKVKLRRAQRDWLSYRDSWLAATHAWYQAQQGTMMTLSAGAQAVQLVKNQALMLQSLDHGTCANADDC